MDIHVSLPDEGVGGTTSDGRPLLVRATTESTGGRLRLIEIEEERRGSAAVHRHDYDEAWYVLAGVYRLYADGAWWDAPTGTFIFVPGGVDHGFTVVEEPARKLSLAFPSGPFDDLTRTEPLGVVVHPGTDASG